jgi:UPF0271 protein
MNPVIDLNCDMGESFGAWQMGQDAKVMPCITSTNIACGFHAGDPDVMRETVALALRHDVAIGAHVGLPDLAGFGRREMRVSAREAHAFTLYQAGALAGFVRAAGATMTHVKPHGALYNMAARDAILADAIATAVRELDARLVLVGLAGSELPRAGRRAGLAVAHEAFADRAYRNDGSLAARGEPGAMIEDAADAAAQGVALCTSGRVRATDGSIVEVDADTLCVHGDRPDAAAFARGLRAALDAAGVRIAPLHADGNRGNPP